MRLGGYWLRLATPFALIVAGVVAGAAQRNDPPMLFALTVTAFAATVITSAVQARRVVALVHEIGSFAEQVSNGEYGARVSTRGPAEIDALAASVNTMAARLAREGHARASFISKVSHELRTPLTVIKGYVYTLRRAEDDPVKADRLDVINGECERLAYLVEDLLELSRAQAGELRISSQLFPLRECVHEVADRLRSVARDRDVGIEVDWACDGARVMGDENRVRQIFANLLTNGIKYAPAGTRVTVLGEQDGSQLVVSVADCGRGIAERDLPHIFEEFFQAPDRSEPGAGLGLAIARELTEAHGGSIAVESRLGEGTTFCVRLPAWTEV